jgi:hypothetical protein
MQLNHSLILYMAHPKLSTRPQAASIASSSLNCPQENSKRIERPG